MATRPKKPEETLNRYAQRLLQGSNNYLVITWDPGTSTMEIRGEAASPEFEAFADKYRGGNIGFTPTADNYSQLIQIERIRPSLSYTKAHQLANRIATGTLKQYTQPWPGQRAAGRASLVNFLLRLIQNGETDEGTLSEAAGEHFTESWQNRE